MAAVTSYYQTISQVISPVAISGILASFQIKIWIKMSLLHILEQALSEPPLKTLFFFQRKLWPAIFGVSRLRSAQRHEFCCHTAKPHLEANLNAVSFSSEQPSHDQKPQHLSELGRQPPPSPSSTIYPSASTATTSIEQSQRYQKRFSDTHSILKH